MRMIPIKLPDRYCEIVNCDTTVKITSTITMHKVFDTDAQAITKAIKVALTPYKISSLHFCTYTIGDHVFIVDSVYPCVTHYYNDCAIITVFATEYEAYEYIVKCLSD